MREGIRKDCCVLEADDFETKLRSISIYQVGHDGWKTWAEAASSEVIEGRTQRDLVALGIREVPTQRVLTDAGIKFFMGELKGWPRCGESLWNVYL